MSHSKLLLVVEDDPGLQKQLKWSLEQFEVIIAGNRGEALAAIRRHTPSVVTLDLGLPPDPTNASEGLATLKEILALAPNTKIIVVTGNDDRANAIEAIALGAYDFYQKPIDPDVLNLIIHRAFHLQTLEQDYRSLQQQSLNKGIIATSPQMQSVMRMVERVAPTQATVLLLGESGTGKEVLAKALHQQSDRSKQPFVAVNCAAIPETLLESELFGYEKGAFTGAVKDRVGKFELAEGGTIFLDEITEMPINLQAKLLRALQEGVIEKLGGNRQISLDIRVVAATNRDPLQAVKEGKLREDLYYRLNVFQLQIPALRERGEDIQLITQAYLDNKSAQISDEALKKLSAYSWPGNVRELQNVLERAAILAGGKPIKPQHLPADIVSGTQFSDRQLSASQGSEAASSGGAPKLQVATEGYSIPQAIAQIECQLIVDAIAACKGNKSKAAKMLEISERSLWYKLEQYQLK